MKSYSDDIVDTSKLTKTMDLNRLVIISQIKLNRMLLGGIFIISIINSCVLGAVLNKVYNLGLF